MEFNGKAALVTGGSKGIGRGVALALAEQGARVAICGRNLAALKAVVQEIEKSGGKALAVKTDVSSAQDVNEMFKQVLSEFGRLDILVNNAGVFFTSSVVDMSEEEWDITLDVDLKGVFLCSQAAARQMIKQKYGRIVSISSIAQLRGGTPGHAHYGAAKAGMAAFAKTLAKEVGPLGITVNTVAPGLIEDTDMGHESKAIMGDSYVNTIPLGCLGLVSDIVEAVLFLASDRARYITGETLNVNGGTLMT